MAPIAPCLSTKIELDAIYLHSGLEVKYAISVTIERINRELDPYPGTLAQILRILSTPELLGKLSITLPSSWEGLRQVSG